MKMQFILTFLSTVSFALTQSKLTYCTHAEQHTDQINLSYDTIPPPPAPEPINVFELPLPPVALNSLEGSCTAAINPHGTGCINQTTNLQSGSFTVDGNHVTSVVEFVGSSNDSIYSGLQIILIKADNTTFSNGDPWKCLTCGVSHENPGGTYPEYSYPQAFKDGKRLLAGPNIIDCGRHDLTSDGCTPSNLNIYPIYWTISSDPSSPSGSMRELRIHPDDTHLAWSSFTETGQLCYLARLKFNPSPSTTHPLPSSPHYSLTNINLLLSPTTTPPLSLSGPNLTINPHSITIGEIRGFSGTGTELIYLGYPIESNNIDVFAINLHTGTIRRLTSHPEYVDPVDISPDDTWHIVMDTRGSGRQMFWSALRGIPPITDLLSLPVVASTRNNGQRRFFQPYLIDRFGDRDGYFGQRVNVAGDGGPGAVNDENWNGLADPKWSPDGTSVVYHQGLVVFPACGGGNPLPCPNSTAPGGRTKRIMIVRFMDRKPLPKQQIVKAPDVVSWASPFIPGQPAPPESQLDLLKEGTYTLAGSLSGHATVVISNFNATATATAVNTTCAPYISVTYISYISTTFPHLILSGSESISVTRNGTTYHLCYDATLTQVDTSGPINPTRDTTTTVNKKTTGPEGFHVTIDILENVFQAEGWLVSEVDGVSWRQPGNGA